MVLLDKNVISATQRLEQAPHVIEWLRRQTPASVFLSSFKIGETEMGIRRQEAVNEA